MQIISFPRRAMLGAILCAALCAQTADSLTRRQAIVQPGAEVKPGETPQGLSTAEWVSIQHQIEQSRYRLETSQQGVAGANPRQGWTLNFDSAGLNLREATTAASTASSGDFAQTPSRLTPLLPTATVGAMQAATPLAAPSTLRLRTTAIGRADALTPVTGATPVVRNNKVELHHTQATEWYLNSALGLEHGYTFERAPQGKRGEVRIQLAVDGGFKAQPAADGVWLTDATGTQRMRYHKLLVLDANRKTLDARLSVAADDRLEIAFDDTHATYPVIVDPLLVSQEAKLVADDGAVGDGLGNSVAVSGDIAVVGAPFDDIGANINQGSAYVFVRNGNSWSQQAKLVAGDGAEGDLLGESVSVSGDTAVVGARGDDIGTNTDQGSAYVFVRKDGEWNQQAKLFAPDGETNVSFGASVALSGDTTVVGAPGDAINDINTNAGQGSAYVFVRSGSTWNQEAKLLAEDGSAADLFGISVAISDDTAVVGAYFDDIGGNQDQGSSYVFVRSGTTWNQQAKLVAADGEAVDLFGTRVAVSGDTAVIGAIGSLSVQGAAYVFVRQHGTWNQQARLRLLIEDITRGARIGKAVSLSGDIVMAGPFIFARNGSTWSQPVKLLDEDDTPSNFFDSVAISGRTVVLGATSNFVNGVQQGNAYVFRIADTDMPASAPTVLNATPVLAVTLTQDLRLRIRLSPRATLRDATTNTPIAGRTVNFTVVPRNAPLCTAVSNASGVARCQANLPNSLRALLRLGYTARFDGDAAYEPSSDKAGVLGLKLF